jgi:hypothetical protein
VGVRGGEAFGTKIDGHVGRGGVERTNSGPNSGREQNHTHTHTHLSRRSAWSTSKSVCLTLKLKTCENHCCLRTAESTTGLLGSGQMWVLSGILWVIRTLPFIRAWALLFGSHCFGFPPNSPDIVISQIHFLRFREVAVKMRIKISMAGGEGGGW